MSNDPWIDEMNEEWEQLKRMITTFAKAHTNQALNKLKDRVDNCDGDNPLMPNEFLSKETVIALIEDIENE